MSNGFGGGALGITNIGKDYTPQKRKNSTNEKPVGWFEELKKEVGSFLIGENTSSWALFAEIVIGAVPIAGQLVDARDIVKAVMNLKDKPSDMTLWFLLIAALIGLIPVAGDAVKSSIKAIKLGGKNPADLLAFMRKNGTGNPEQAIRKALDIGKLKSLLNKILTPKFLNSLSRANKQKLVQIQKDFDRKANIIIKEIEGWLTRTPATASSNVASSGRALGNKPSTALASTNRNASGETVSHNSSVTSRVARKGVMKKHTPKCFKPGDNLKKKMSKSPKEKAKIEKEYYRQLKDQEAGINNLTVEEYLAGRKAFNKLKSETGKGRPSSNAAQAKKRREYEDKINDSLEKSYRKQGKSASEAKKLAAARSKVIVSELNALHNPDLVAGGKDQVTRLGRADVNKSIGSQWKTRVAGMDKAAEEALKSQGGATQMNVELNRCR